MKKTMKQTEFITRFVDEAQEAGRVFNLHPVVILAQAALESGWGKSTLARAHHNLFGLTAYGRPNDYWHGCGVPSRTIAGLRFRKYNTTADSFMDYARLIRTCYPQAANLSRFPEAFAKEIAYSRYITESNGDNRETYRETICLLCRQISSLLSHSSSFNS